MKHLHLLWITLALTLAGCANHHYYQPSETSAGSSGSASGITVYGEVDTSVVHTR